MSYLLVCGVLVFARGFLLRRQVQPEKSVCSDNVYCSGPADTGIGSACSISGSPLHHWSEEEDLCSQGRAKVILIVIDALKHEFASFSDTEDPKNFHNRLTVINNVLTQEPDNARLYKFIADPPTTTMQRLNGLTTGSLPTFIDMGSNFASTEINEDNIIDQLRAKGKKAVFMGDDTWTSLYPRRFEREFPFPSFNVWDLDSVDEGIKSHLQPEMQKNDWDLLIAHFLGVDHCGHRHGPFHSEMTRKLDEMNAVISDVINAMDNNTVLVVLGDHGMTKTGDHGGETEDEVTAALFVYSRLGLLPTQWSPKGTTVRQVDLVPTLATTLGIPIPFSNLGSVIIDSLPKSNLRDVVTPLQDWKYALMSLWSNIRQVVNYIETYATRNNEFTMDKLQASLKMYSSLSNRVKNVLSEEELVVMAKQGFDFLSGVRAMCEKVWVQFDTFSMTWGLIFTFVVLFCLFLLIEAMHGDKLHFVVSGVQLTVVYIGLVLSAVVSYVLSLLRIISNFEKAYFISTFGTSFLVLALILAQNSNTILDKWTDAPRSRSYLGMIWRVVCLFTLWAMVSNSYVMSEGQLLSFFLVSLMCTLVYTYRIPKDLGARSANRPAKSMLGWLKQQIHPTRLRMLLVTLAVSALLRTTHHYWKCRSEEAGCKSQSYFHQTEHKKKGDLSADPHCLIMLICSGLWVTFTRMWLRSCGNLSGYSVTVLFARYAPTVITVCSGSFWVLQGLPGETRGRMFKQWQLQLLPWTVYALSGLTIISLVLCPLCVFVVQNKRKSKSLSVSTSANLIPQLFNQMKQIISGQSTDDNPSETVGPNPVVYGLATAYSAAFTVLAMVLVPVMGLLLGSQWAPAIMLCACAATLLLLLISMLRFENAVVSVQLLSTSWPAVVCWSLLAQYAFYGTGHQATFSSIHWDAAMVGTSGNIASSRFFPGLLVIINTFCSHILMGLLLPLLLIAPLTLRVMRPRWAAVAVGDQELAQGELMLYQREDLMYRSLTTLSARYIFLQGVRSLACMFSATIHARHLMVWAIFAPKFIFEAVSLFVTLPCVLLAYVFVGRISKCVDTLINSLDAGNDSASKISQNKR